MNLSQKRPMFVNLYFQDHETAWKTYCILNKSIETKGHGFRLSWVKTKLFSNLIENEKANTLAITPSYFSKQMQFLDKSTQDKNKQEISKKGAQDALTSILKSLDKV